MGADKLKIIAAYAADNICMGPEFEDESDLIKSKTNYLVSVRNESGEREIVFYLRNKKVVAIEVNTIFNDAGSEIYSLCTSFLIGCTFQYVKLRHAHSNGPKR